jgi:xanthine dehydrogenase YagR molybdenum-binding subunit
MTPRKATEAAPSKPGEVEVAGAGPTPQVPPHERSRQQSMTYGIVGDHLEPVTRRVPADEPPPLPPNADLTVIGRSLPRFDAVQKVTGRATYTADIQLPGMLFGRRVVSTVPHARVAAIDTSEAERHPGVRAVWVLDRQLQTAQLRNQNATAKTRYPVVRYVGQPLAGIAAESQRAGARAAAARKRSRAGYRPGVRTPARERGAGACRGRDRHRRRLPHPGADARADGDPRHGRRLA